MATNSDLDRDERLKGKKYVKELRRLQAELCKLQDWVKYKGLRVIIVFEGRDAAGKGGTIRAITERVSPRVFRVVALPAPSDREKSQMYFQRYMQHFPSAGEIVIFDRSWYNRAGVEHVMGFCSPEQHRKFLKLCPITEKYIVDGGIQLIKYWMEVGKKEQERRFGARIKDPLRYGPRVVSTVVRVFPGTGHNVSGHGQQTCTVVCRSLGQQKESAAQLHFSFVKHHPLPKSSAGQGEVTEAQEQKRIRRPGLSERKARRARTLLNSEGSKRLAWRALQLVVASAYSTGAKTGSC